MRNVWLGIAAMLAASVAGCTPDNSQPAREDAMAQIGAAPNICWTRKNPVIAQYQALDHIAYAGGTSHDASHYVIEADVVCAYVKSPADLRRQMHAMIDAAPDDMIAKVVVEQAPCDGCSPVERNRASLHRRIDAAWPDSAWHAGQKVTRRGRFEFLKTDKGWRLQQPIQLAARNIRSAPAA